MMRYLALAAVGYFLAVTAFTQAGGPKGVILDYKGTLTKDDPKDPQRGGPSHVHSVKLQKGKSYTIDLMSAAFDSFLRLRDPKGNQIAEDDDGGEGLNSRIIFNCNADGDYKIVATSLGPSKGGAYALTVKLTGAVAATATAHTLLMGKAAPDFKGDFAVNGQPASLAEFKGKVVLLYFWEARSSACADLLPKFNDWHKAYKNQGLAIVGATFYLSDIGQALSFDKDKGTLKKIAKGTREADQAALREYAKHHKVEHLLLALPKTTAFTAYDAYAVNGVPQLVLIDRKGMVRLIELWGKESGEKLEKEIKKAIGEK